MRNPGANNAVNPIDQQKFAEIERIVKDHSAILSVLTELTENQKRLIGDGARDVEKQRKMLADALEDNLREKQANTATFAKMQEYVNQ